MASEPSKASNTELRLVSSDENPIPALVARFVTAHPHLQARTIAKYRYLNALPGLTTADLYEWITAPSTGRGGRGPVRPRSNNDVRCRLSIARNFISFLIRENVLDRDPLADAYRHIAKYHPRLYGKRQEDHCARFLTQDEAHQLLNACQDGTWKGSRDQLAIRLGLLGLRKAEILRLQWRHYQLGVIRCPGKGNRIREVHPGPQLRDMVDRWQRGYESALGRPVQPDEPIICALSPVGVRWGVALSYGDGFDRALRRRAELAGLGWLCAHDLRRSCANILHNAKTSDGGHLFDLLDIAQALDHVDPAVTQRSYIDQVSTDVKVRAGVLLD
jgi:integrase